eukprot:g16301.t1
MPPACASKSQQKGNCTKHAKTPAMRLIWVGEFLEWRWPVANMASPGTWFGSVLEMVEEADSENQNCENGWDQGAKEANDKCKEVEAYATDDQRWGYFFYKISDLESEAAGEAAWIQYRDSPIFMNAQDLAENFNNQVLGKEGNQMAIDIQIAKSQRIAELRGGSSPDSDPDRTERRVMPTLGGATSATGRSTTLALADGCEDDVNHDDLTLCLRNGTMRKAVQSRAVNAAYKADMVKELKLILTMLESQKMGDTFQSKSRTMATGPHTDSAVHTAKDPPKSAAPRVASAAKATTSTTTAADEGAWLEDGTPVKIFLGETDSGAKGGGKEGSNYMMGTIEGKAHAVLPAAAAVFNMKEETARRSAAWEKVRKSSEDPTAGSSTDHAIRKESSADPKTSMGAGTNITKSTVAPATELQSSGPPPGKETALPEKNPQSPHRGRVDVDEQGQAFIYTPGTKKKIADQKMRIELMQLKQLQLDAEARAYENSKRIEASPALEGIGEADISVVKTRSDRKSGVVKPNHGDVIEEKHEPPPVEKKQPVDAGVRVSEAESAAADSKARPKSETEEQLQQHKDAKNEKDISKTSKSGKTGGKGKGKGGKSKGEKQESLSGGGKGEKGGKGGKSGSSSSSGNPTDFWAQMMGKFKGKAGKKGKEGKIQMQPASGSGGSSAPSRKRSSVILDDESANANLLGAGEVEAEEGYYGAPDVKVARTEIEEGQEVEVFEDDHYVEEWDKRVEYAQDQDATHQEGDDITNAWWGSRGKEDFSAQQ